MFIIEASEKSSERATFWCESRTLNSLVNDDTSVLAEKHGCMDRFDGLNSDRSQDALAVLEAAIWLVVGLPVALLSLLITGVVYDQNILRRIPVEALRSVTVNPLFLPTGSFDMNFEVDEPALRTLLPQLLQTATTRAVSQSMNMRKVSARACFWTYAVNVESGFVRAPVREVCSAVGGKGAGLNFAAELRAKTSERIGVPLYGDAGGFIDKVVLIGVKVAGEANDFGLSDAYSTIEFGAVQVPRQEVNL
jgi:hypothetical protein